MRMIHCLASNLYGEKYTSSGVALGGRHLLPLTVDDHGEHAHTGQLTHVPRRQLLRCAIG